MEELSFKTKVFEGPLDLMLSLISKHKLNIMDIEISVLLEQFLLYIEKMQKADIEIAGEFMETAARLIYIKSASLLPKHEIEEMKKELSGALIEYAICKQAAKKLSELFVGADLFTREAAVLPADNSYRYRHEADELPDALRAVFGRDRLLKFAPVSLKPIVAQKFVTVFTKIVYVLRRIQYGGRMEIKELYSGQTRSEQVAIFLALLELSKYGRVSFSEDNNYLEFNSDPTIITETDGDNEIVTENGEEANLIKSEIEKEIENQEELK